MSQIPSNAVLAYASEATDNWRLRSVRNRGTFTIVFLLITCGFAVLSILVYYSQIDLLTQAKSGVRITIAQGQANDQRIALIAGTKIVLFLVSMIVFFFWLYRATDNLPALGVHNARFSPGRSIGNFFIPFANLVLGYQSVQEVWKGSGSDAANNSSPLIGFWWFAWLLDGVIAQVASAMKPERPAPGQRPNLDAYISMTWAFIYSNIALVLAGVLLVLIIRRIGHMQAEKFYSQSAAVPTNSLAGIVPPPPAR